MDSFSTCHKYPNACHQYQPARSHGALLSAPEGNHQPTARPRSLITGKRMQKINWGPNREEILGTEFAKRSKDKNFDNVQREIYGAFEKTFMMYLPRLCEHCLNPACVAACPGGAAARSATGNAFNASARRNA